MELPLKSVPLRRHAETLLLLAALILMAYSNSFSAGFPLDNGSLILRSERVHAVSSQNLQDILTHSYWWPELESGLYRPVATLSYLFNYAVLDGEADPFSYHVVNLLLHLANAFLVYLLVLDLARRYGPAFFAAALWALHPVSTESVTNIVGRPEGLAAFGVLGALLTYIYSTRQTGRRRALWRAATMVFTTIAVFSKENGVMVAPLIVLYDVAFRIPRGASPKVLAFNLWKLFREGYIYVALPVLAMLGIRWDILAHSGPMELPFVDNPLSGADLLTRWATVIRIAGKYLWLLVWPRTLSADYSYNQLPLLNRHTANWSDAAAALAIAALLWLAVRCYRGRPVAFFLLWFSALTLLPATNLLVTTGTIMAERLLYLPAVGFAVVLSIGVYGLADNLGARRVAAIVLCGIGGAYGVRTYFRNPDWKDDYTVFSSVVEAAPASFKAHWGLGAALLNRDPQFLGGERAIDEAQKAAAIVDGLPSNRSPTRVYYFLASAYRKRGDSLARIDENGVAHAEPGVLRWYEKALDAALRGALVDRAQNENYRQAELARGTPPDRIHLAGLLDMSLELGVIYLRLGDASKALEAFLYGRRVGPRSPEVYFAIASAYLVDNKTEEAATAILESLELKPSRPLLERVAKLYGKVDGGACAVTGRGADRSLDRHCAIVRRDACNAYRDLAAAWGEGKLGSLPDPMRVRAREAGCQ